MPIRQKKRPYLLFGCLVSLLLLAYVGVYIQLSAHGQFEPAAIGIDYVSDYDWAPRGFVRDYKWNSTMLKIFAPCWRVDRRYWHRPQDADPELYPVNEPKDQDLGKIRGPWG
jgi:hypothetical protein